MENNLDDLGPRKKFAKGLAEKLLKDAAITELPVSLQKIIEYLKTKYDLDVQKVSLSKAVSGLLVTCRDIDGEYSTIIFNENHPWCRKRFTIAHEIGHLLLGHTCNKNDPTTAHNEKEANCFAAELLVPAKVLKKTFKKITKIPELSKLFRVSAETMGYRVIECRLI
jgi:hypothetical protein